MTTTPAPLVTSCDLQLAHDITASCPLRCLQLSARVHNALCHHLRDPGATVANLVTLCRSGELDDVRSVGPRTAIQIRSVLARCAGLVPPEKEYPHMTVPAEAPARYLLASHPLLRWDAIAAHARDHHQHTWPDDNTARTAITGAFDAITPYDCGYDPADGTITSPPLPAPPTWAPRWNDPQVLNCTIATIAASTTRCDLQEIHDQITPDTDPC